MTEQVSALLDGELSDHECGAQIELLRQDAQCREAWATYNLIGDALRGHVGRGCAKAVSARLEAEPVVLCPGAMRRSRKGPAWTAVSVAASVAAVAFVAWTALPMMSQPAVQVAGGANVLPAVASAAPATTLAVARASASPLPLRSDRAAVSSSPVPTGPDVDNYLLAHQQYSPSNAIQGVAPYVRLVSDERR